MNTVLLDFDETLSFCLKFDLEVTTGCAYISSKVSKMNKVGLRSVKQKHDRVVISRKALT